MSKRKNSNAICNNVSINKKTKIHNQCDSSGCMKIPVFNFEGQLRGKFCASHKKAGMVDVIKNAANN